MSRYYKWLTSFKFERSDNMSVRVRVLNYEKSKKELEEKKETKIDANILTPDYVKSLNAQIAYNIDKNKASIEPNGPILKRTIMR